MDNSTEKWLNVINSGRAFSNAKQLNFPKYIKKDSHQLFCNILRKHISQGDTALEAGCGFAYDSFCLSSSGIKVTALDISEKLIFDLQQVQKDTKCLQFSKLEFVVGSIFELSKLKKKFNLVFNHGVYEHWLLKDERRQILKNISSVLSGKGKYVVAVPNLKNQLFNAALSKKDVPEMCELSIEDLELELCQNNFRVIESGYLFVSPGFEQWLKKKWITYPIKFIDKFYYKLPTILKKLLAAHIYCVAEKI